MQGLIAELQYPSQNITENAESFTHSLQNARNRYIVKKGNQQNMNPPTIIPKVLAAFVSIRNRFTWALMFLFPILEISFGFEL